MPASLQLPTETWQTILRYAIHVPDFLDPDSFEGKLDSTESDQKYRNPRLEERPYWNTERIKNALKRVCRAWSTYFSQFDHRYVRMIDLWHGKFGDIALKTAIRISFTLYNCKCGEASCTAPPNGSLVDVARQFRQFCGAAVFAFSFLPAEILDLRGGFSLGIWNAAALRSLAQAQVIMVWSFGGGEEIENPIFSQTPNLRHLHGRVDGNINHVRFISRTLVTLSFQATRYGRYQSLVWDLPALRHLRVGYDLYLESSIYISVALIPLLRAVGRQLQSLHIDSEDASYHMPNELWNMCLQIEKLHAGRRIWLAPPASHPIKAISIPLAHLNEEYLLWLQWPGIKRIIIGDKWTMVGIEERESLYQTWMREVKEKGVVWEDIEGVMLGASIRRDTNA